MDNALKERGVAPQNEQDWQRFLTSMLEQRNSALRGFYSAGFAYLNQTLNEAPCLAIDIETTGLDSQNDKIVSIGLVEFDCRRVYLNTAKHWLVNPGELSDSSIVVHGITHSDISSAPSINAVMPEVLSAMAGRLTVVHYRAMEREFFRTLSLAVWQVPWLFPVIDTFALEASCLSRKQNWFDRMRRKSLPSLRLPDARLRYNLPEYENHNAVIDAMATAELLQAQAQYWHLRERKVADLVL
ncbi:hypothetical protein A3765_08615 [Oleiphilus sp. HI0130]|nr:hypothetical protein A3750_10465 [Oleiphilus sp. HI0079]KZZ43711.1 hypothetical protein A3758_03720 [Oleiphilus sp. HI0118]KZZ78033.1 hypothetical protein A3765_08615 [Oleiphilus sp. HI0130]KZZ80973.1 hypothetical protein A3767_09655 [Oleiphilus sp. HI0133]